MRLYLASTSPARLALLRQVGIEPIVVPSQVDEEAAVIEAERTRGPLSAAELVLLLARLKAEAIGRTLPGGEPIDGLVLGGDSAFELDGVIYGKPHRPEVARERWLRQRGRSGVLHSGHWMIDLRRPGAPASAVGADAPAVGAVGAVTSAVGADTSAVGAATSAVVEFADDITEAEIDAYIATGEPLQVAGAFTIDGMAAPFIRSITGAPSTVIGMSLPTLRDLSGRLGVPFTELWA